MLRGFDDGAINWDARVEQLADGKISYFSNEPIDVGFPPKWNDNLLQDKPGPPKVHFSKIDEFGCGDVKCIWEPNRFGFTYDLVRAYWRTGNERAAEVFWQAAEDWLEHNPPNKGINWKCGQESTFRAMAWCFALWGFADCAATTPQRVLKAIQLMRATGRRVEAHLGYALSQRNNHGISEAMGLFTFGLLFPFFNESQRWVALGQKYLEKQAQTLIYDDGGFAQHSANYHRVMLDDCLYAARIGEINGKPLSEQFKKRVARAGVFLTHFTEAQTGQVPRYGQDDGALILPLTHRPYDDYRPVSQAAAAVFDMKFLPWPRGNWNEQMLWLCGRDSLNNPSCGFDTEVVGDENYVFPHSGSYVLRAGRFRACVRAARYRHRPSQLDQLHVDVWWEGVNVALDPGTFSYNAEHEWSGIPLSKTAAHNTVMIEGNEQAEQAGSRFIFLPWPQAEILSFDESREDHRHDYQHAGLLIKLDNTGHHRQLLRLSADVLIVLDTLDLPHAALPSTLHWHLADAPHTLDLQTGLLMMDYEPGRFSVLSGMLHGDLTYQLERAVQASHLGWYAPRYMQKSPALWLTASTPPGPSSLFTIFSPGQVRVEQTSAGLSIHANGKTFTLTQDDWPGSQNDPLATLKHLAQQWSI